MTLGPLELESLSKTSLIIELHKFKTRTVVGSKQDPLKWWKKHAHQFPCAFLLHLHLQSGWSRQQAWTVTQKRNRLTDEHVILLVYLRNAWDKVDDSRAQKAKQSGKALFLSASCSCTSSDSRSSSSSSINNKRS
jgi:hypothetical protein